ncbi:hypothetical protein H6P81_018198 [Aristolochia fimbriata]|uniref:Aminotransferase-like plant mobile domain-containing protein n=1 Tax=Aristolochia fimbriata TaxID=158543 RepID=A0AAV7E284_ARIFI|nr:hypothetical protein H6P81_018198 [Aristolochia fimbriata]
MAALSVTLTSGLRAFDHTVTVGRESDLTLALNMEGDASRLTYCPSGESVLGGHAVKPPSSLVDRSRPYGSLSRPLATGDRVFFLPCPDSFENEDVAAGPETFALQSVSRLANQPLLPRTFEDQLMGRAVERNLHAPDTTLDLPIPFLYEWTILLLGRCNRTLRSAGVYYGLWASIFQYRCDASMIRAFLEAWSIETNTLVTCQGKLSITLLVMDRIFGLPISGYFYDEVSPMSLTLYPQLLGSHFGSVRRTMSFQSLIPEQHGRLELTISVAVGSDGEEEDYDSDRSHPRRRRPKGKKQASKKRAPLSALNDTSASASKKKKACVEAQPASLPSPPTFLPPISEIEPHIEPQPSCPPPKLGPPETVQIWSSPEVSEAPQEELSHPEATVQTYLCVVAAPEGTEVVETLKEVAPASIQLEASLIQDAAPPVVREDVAPSVQEAVEVVQEEAPVIQEEAPTTEEVVEVVQERAPVVQEAPVVQDTVTSLTLPAPPASTPLVTPSQQLLSYFKGMMLQISQDQITSRMLSPDVVRNSSLATDAGFVISKLQEVGEDVTHLQDYTQKLQALKEIENLAGEKTSRTSRDSAESDTRKPWMHCPPSWTMPKSLWTRLLKIFQKLSLMNRIPVNAWS